MRCIVDHLVRGDEEGGPGFDVVLLGYRGIGYWADGKPVKLTNCRWYTVNSHDDIVEPFRYVYEKYCKPYGRKALAFGNSFGSNLMINTIGKLDFFECFCFTSAIIDMPKTNSHIKKNFCGKLAETFAEDLF